MTACPDCGTPLRPAAATCPDCGVEIEAETVPAGTLRDLPEYRCGQCGQTFGTNLAEDKVECAYCEARRCPHCEMWFGGES